ncbi:GreA/GreB family elongation factor [Marinobacter subterrani]|uniref:GreA/GreB family elongation factor n=1 Tax=Marinobacter subterrani TaxID=1658765 RepID=UPI0009E50974
MRSNDVESKLRLVYPRQAEVDEEHVSVLAPAGAALLGLRVGDRIDWPLAGKKTLSLKIIRVTHAN